MLRRVEQLASSRALELLGPILDVVVRPAGDGLHEDSAAQVFTASMLIDTGAGCTMLDDRVPRRFGLTPLRETLIGGVSGEPDTRVVYRMELCMGMTDHRGRAHDIAHRQDVVGMRVRRGHELGFGLLGRDYLARVMLVYDGRRGLFEISSTVG